MADSMELDVIGIRRAAGELSEVANSISGVLSNLTAAARAHEHRWGDDSYGTQFADGSDGHPGYVSTAQHLEAVIESKAALLQEYVQGLRKTADLMAGTESTNADNFTK